MKVLQFIPSLNAYDGGTTTYMQELTPALGKLVELHVCALGNINDCVKLENATVHTIELSIMHIFRMRHQWMALLDKVKPEIVHINCCWLPQCALIQYWTRQWQKKNTPYLLLTPHGMLEPWIIRRNYWTKKVPAIWLYQRWAVKNADVIIATAEEEKTHIAELGWNRRIEMVPNGIATEKIVMKSEWHDAKDLLFMSRLHPKKGLEMLVDSMSKLGDENRLTLKIAGDGDPVYVESLKNIVKDKNLADRITFVGPVYGERKWELIRQADVVVLPSYSENFGLIVAESLASGTPVLTTKGTPWRAIEERQCGWWVEPTVEEIYDTLLKISTVEGSQLELMGRRARTLVEEQFDIHNLANALCNLYKLNEVKL